MSVATKQDAGYNHFRLSETETKHNGVSQHDRQEIALAHDEQFFAVDGDSAPA